jgi:hypothetical protein
LVVVDAVSELQAQRDRAVGMPGGLLVEFACSVDPHRGQLDAVPGHQALRAEADRRLRDPGPTRDVVAGTEQIAVERGVVRDQMLPRRSPIERMVSAEKPGVIAAEPR